MYGDVFLAKYDSTGNQKWIKQLVGAQKEEAFSIATDSNNNVYITGITNTVIDVMSGDEEGGDVFLAKYDSAGNQKWKEQLGTTGWDHANGIATDSGNNVYITGTTSGYLGDDEEGVAKGQMMYF